MKSRLIGPRWIGLSVVAVVAVIIGFVGCNSPDAPKDKNADGIDKRNDRRYNQQIYQRERQGGSGASGGK